MARGRLITYEGCEGSGKSTQAALLSNYLRERGLEVANTREPGGTRIGERCRDILLDPQSDPTPRAELFLLQAARAQIVETVIDPALARGVWVVCDRYIDSSLAYQGSARGLSMDAIRPIIDFATSGLEPDITFLLDGDLEVLLRRARVRGAPGENRFDDESFAFHSRVQKGYRELAVSFPRFRVIDMTPGFEATPDYIFAEIRKHVDKLRARG